MSVNPYNFTTFFNRAEVELNKLGSDLDSLDGKTIDAGTAKIIADLANARTSLALAWIELGRAARGDQQ